MFGSGSKKVKRNYSILSSTCLLTFIFLKYLFYSSQFKVCNSVVLNIFIDLCSYYQEALYLSIHSSVFLQTSLSECWQCVQCPLFPYHPPKKLWRNPEIKKWRRSLHRRIEYVSSLTYGIPDQGGQAIRTKLQQGVVFLHRATEGARCYAPTDQ